MFKQLPKPVHNPLVCAQLRKKIRDRQATPKVKLYSKQKNFEPDGYFFNDLSGLKHSRDSKNVHLYLTIRFTQALLLINILFGDLILLIFNSVLLILLEYYLSSFHPRTIEHLKLWSIMVIVLSLLYLPVSSDNTLVDVSYRRFIIFSILLLVLLIIFFIPTKLVYYKLQ